MRRPFIVLLVFALAAGGSAAQVWMDTFDYPAGPNLGNWVKHFGATWTATGTQVHAQPVAKYQHLTQPTLIFQDCVVEADVDYNTGHGGLEFGGVILRANAPSRTRENAEARSPARSGRTSGGKRGRNGTKVQRREG